MGVSVCGKAGKEHKTLMGKPKIVMTLLVRNEEDIIRQNIEYHLSQGVSFFIATDNLSLDGSKAILKEYEKKGVLHYRFEDSDQFDQHEWVTDMARMAFEEHGADWVINNDADEFWLPRTGDLPSAFRNIPKDVNVLDVDRSNFVMVEQPGVPFYERMVFRTVKSLNSLGRPLPSKVAHRGHANVRVSAGAHSVSGFDVTKLRADDIQVLHFPMRSYKQFESKIRLGGAAYERNLTVPKGVGITWRTLYSELQRNSHLHDHVKLNNYDLKRCQEELSSGQLIEDHRLRDYLSQLFG